MGQEEKYMDEYIKEISEKIEDKKEYYAKISDKIWEYAEPRFQEYKSSELLQQTLKKEGFSIKSNLAGEETAFIAEYGSGKPVIGFLGEFDALPGLSQKADTTERIPEEKTSDSKYESVPEREKKQNPDSGHTDNCGHGCGHQLIGTGTLASVIALKDFMKEHNLKGTIRYYGCPAEENAGGKAFLVRDGYFDDCDLALCWHPEQGRRACYGSTKANFRVFFTFHGTPAHASMCPELGRSALDAVELMDIGVNYMREHMIDEARIHYAITDTGGDAPNVVQSRAQVLYAIRAPKITQVKELYNRVCNIAKGAALMTETGLLQDEPSMLLMDLGGWTVDLMRIDNAIPATDTAHSLELGMIRCVDDIREQVRRETGLSLTDAQIENMLAGHPCTVSDTVRDIVNKQGRKYTEHLLSATMEAGFDLHAIPAVLLGGGASVVSRHLSPKDGLCKTIFLLDDKVNAVGFERALTAVSRRKSEV